MLDVSSVGQIMLEEQQQQQQQNNATTKTTTTTSIGTIRATQKRIRPKLTKFVSARSLSSSRSITSTSLTPTIISPTTSTATTATADETNSVHDNDLDSLEIDFDLAKQQRSLRYIVQQLRTECEMDEDGLLQLEFERCLPMGQRTIIRVYYELIEPRAGAYFVDTKTTRKNQDHQSNSGGENGDDSTNGEQVQNPDVLPRM